MTQLRKHYAANRKRLAAQRVRNYAAMRAAKEHKRMERATSEPVLPDLPAVKAPRRVRAPVEIRVRIGDRWFCLSAHVGPWGMLPAKTDLVNFVAGALALA